MTLAILHEPFSNEIIQFTYVKNPLPVERYFDSISANGDFFHVPLTFANSLDPDQDQQNVGPDLDPKCLAL